MKPEKPSRILSPGAYYGKLALLESTDVSANMLYKKMFRAL